MTDSDSASQPITLAAEIDAAAFDEPRQQMWERLVEKYGQETIAERVGANLSQDLTGQGMPLVNALWDNRDQMQVEPQSCDATGLDEHQGDVNV
jgi:hypothetical protein